MLSFNKKFALTALVIGLAVLGAVDLMAYAITGLPILGLL